MSLRYVIFIFISFISFGCLVEKKHSNTKHNLKRANKFIENGNFSKAAPLLSVFCSNCTTNKLIDTNTTKILADCYYEDKTYDLAINASKLLLDGLVGENNKDYIKNRIANIYSILGYYDSAKLFLSSSSDLNLKSRTIIPVDSSLALYSGYNYSIMHNSQFFYDDKLPFLKNKELYFSSSRNIKANSVLTLNNKNVGPVDNILLFPDINFLSFDLVNASNFNKDLDNIQNGYYASGFYNSASMVKVNNANPYLFVKKPLTKEKQKKYNLDFYLGLLPRKINYKGNSFSFCTINNKEYLYILGQIDGVKKKGIYRICLSDSLSNKIDSIGFYDWKNDINSFSINSSGDIIVFSSREDNRLDLDLYVASLLPINDSVSNYITFGTTKRLENGIINTIGNEAYPIIVESTLYFSSDGLAGYGNYDIFSIPLTCVTTRFYRSVHPDHLSYPINSVFDDYGLTVVNKEDGSNNEVIFSSNREGHFHLYKTINSAQRESYAGLDNRYPQTITQKELSEDFRKYNRQNKISSSIKVGNLFNKLNQDNSKKEIRLFKSQNKSTGIITLTKTNDSSNYQSRFNEEHKLNTQVQTESNLSNKNRGAFRNSEIYRKREDIKEYTVRHLFNKENVDSVDFKFLSDIKRDILTNRIKKIIIFSGSDLRIDYLTLNSDLLALKRAQKIRSMLVDSTVDVKLEVELKTLLIYATNVLQTPSKIIVYYK